MILFAFILALAIILAVAFAFHIGYMSAMKDFDKDIDKIFWEILNEEEIQ